MIRVHDFSDKKFALDPLALGRREGEVFRRAIQEYEKVFKDYCQRAKNWDWLWVRRFTGYGVRKYLLYLGSKFENYIPENFKKEMRGIAEVSGASYGFIRFINVVDDIINTFLCSAVAVFDQQSGGYIYGANLDYPVLINHLRENVVVIRRPNTLSVAFPGYIGVLRGVNRWGNVMISLTSKTDHNAVGVPNGLLYRLCLERGCEIQNIFSILSTSKRGASNNVLFGGKYWPRIFESVFNQYKIINSPSLNGNVCVTNHFRSPELKRHQKITKPLLSVDVDDYYFSLEFSEKRLTSLEDFGRANTDIGNAKVISFLKHLTQDPLLCNEGTIFTAVFDLPRSELIVRVPHRGEGVDMPFGF